MVERRTARANSTPFREPGSGGAGSRKRVSPTAARPLVAKVCFPSPEECPGARQALLPAATRWRRRAELPIPGRRWRGSAPSVGPPGPCSPPLPAQVTASKVREPLGLRSPQYLPLDPGFQILGRTFPAHVTRPPPRPALRGPPRLAAIPRSAPGRYRANPCSDSGSEPTGPNCAGWRKGGGRGLDLCGPHCPDPGPSHPLLPPPGLHLLRASQNAFLASPPNGGPGD